MSDAWTVHYVDQMVAAIRHAAAGVGQVAKTQEMRALHFPAGKFPDFVERYMAEHDRIMDAGEGMGCPHVDPRRPAIWVTVVWKPGVVVCGKCPESDHLFDCADDYLCDGCGQREGLKTYSAMFNMGPILIAAGLCGPCHKELVTP